MTEVKIEKMLEQAAQLLDCQADEFMDWAVRENGDLVVIAPSGQKYVYSPQVLKKAAQAATTATKPDVAAETGTESPANAEQTFLAAPDKGTPEPTGARRAEADRTEHDSAKADRKVHDSPKRAAKVQPTRTNRNKNQ